LPLSSIGTKLSGFHLLISQLPVDQSKQRSSSCLILLSFVVWS